MKEMNSKMLFDLSKKVDEVGKLLRRYFDEQSKKGEEKLLKSYTHEQRSAYYDGKSAAREESRKYF